MKINKKILIITSVAILILAIIALIIVLIHNNNNNNGNSQITTITITYSNSDKIEENKEIVIKDKSKIKELIKYLDTVKTSKKSDSNLALIKEIIIEFGNNTNIIIQTSVGEYCFYEDDNTKKLVPMPKGLLDMVKKELEIEN